MNRDKLIQHFLQDAGWGEGKRSFLAGDASLRSYDRITMGDKTAVLMDAPPPEHPENFLPAQLVLVERFVLVDTLLKEIGIHSPAILAKDIENGLILLEDLGDNSFTRLLNADYDARKLYRLATESIIQTQKNFKLPSSEEMVYDREKMVADTAHLPNWVVKYVSKIDLTQNQWDEYNAIWAELLDKMQAIPRGSALYDYHVDNLILTPAGTCGVLDFQDVRITATTYDIMTLLEDERRLVSDEIKKEMFDLYFGAFPELDTPEIRRLSKLVALQRHIKVVGQFVRYYYKEGKDKYLQYVPLVWFLIEKCLEDEDCAKLKAWLDTYVPKELRTKDLTQDA